MPWEWRAATTPWLILARTIRIMLAECHNPSSFASRLSNPPMTPNDEKEPSRRCHSHLLARRNSGSIRPSVAQTPPSASPKGVASSLQPFIDNHVLAGAVTLVASKEKILSLEAVGYADIDAQKPMRNDNVFWIASMTKPITATALMMLVDEGKVNVDDPVEKYLPEFNGQMLQVERRRARRC